MVVNGRKNMAILIILRSWRIHVLGKDFWCLYPSQSKIRCCRVWIGLYIWNLCRRLWSMPCWKIDTKLSHSGEQNLKIFRKCKNPKKRSRNWNHVYGRIRMMWSRTCYGNHRSRKCKVFKNRIFSIIVHQGLFSGYINLTLYSRLPINGLFESVYSIVFKHRYWFE